MLAKLSIKRQLTLPKQIVEALGTPSHLEVQIDSGCLILTPAQPGSVNAVRRKLQALDLVENDVTDAVA